MDTKKPCAERMRPILHAMEQSIDNARRNRTKQPLSNEPSRVESGPKNLAGNWAVPPVSNPLQLDDSTAPRLKAKPKRLNAPLPNPFPQTPYRSQAG